VKESPQPKNFFSRVFCRKLYKRLHTSYGKYNWFEKFKAFQIENTLKLVTSRNDFHHFFKFVNCVFRALIGSTHSGGCLYWYSGPSRVCPCLAHHPKLTGRTNFMQSTRICPETIQEDSSPTFVLFKICKIQMNWREVVHEIDEILLIYSIFTIVQ
jgi:hypothetical protein